MFLDVHFDSNHFDTAIFVGSNKFKETFLQTGRSSTSLQHFLMPERRAEDVSERGFNIGKGCDADGILLYLKHALRW